MLLRTSDRWGKEGGPTGQAFEIRTAAHSHREYHYEEDSDLHDFGEVCVSPDIDLVHLRFRLFPGSQITFRPVNVAVCVSKLNGMLAEVQLL